MLANKNPYIKEAYNQLEYISKDKQKRLEYEAREKAIRDYNAFISEAREDGLAQGLAQGRKEATEQSKIEIAKNLLDILDVETIAIKTRLPVSTVLMLKDNK